MQKIKLIHNPTSGDESHSKRKLMKLIRSEGYDCKYASTKEKGPIRIGKGIDLVAVGGGDGSIRKVAGVILKRKLLQRRWPIALLPLGTANNISKTLGIPGSATANVKAWKDARHKPFDVGRISGVPGSKFFMEAFGYGIFPYLMMEMHKAAKKHKPGTPEEELQLALKTLHKITESYKARNCTLIIDGKDHSGRYVMAEIMNIRSIGPNLVLAKNGDPGDEWMDVVLISEADMDRFRKFVEARMNGSEETYPFAPVKAKEVSISWEGTHVHVDDKVVKLKESAKVEIEVMPGMLTFLVPGNNS